MNYPRLNNRIFKMAIILCGWVFFAPEPTEKAKALSRDINIHEFHRDASLETKLRGCVLCTLSSSSYINLLQK